MKRTAEVLVDRQRHRGATALAFAMVVAIMVTVAGPTSASAVQAVDATDNSALVVDSRDDAGDADPADGVCATDLGACTLRAAIEQANHNPGSDRVEFAIPGQGVHRISLGSPLPSINDARGGVFVDGYSQPGASPNSLQHGSNATILIEVHGGGTSTFLIESAENVLRGLSISGSDFLIELRGEAADGNQIIGSFIGLDAEGNEQPDQREGVSMNLGPDRNRIGTPALADRNVIGGHYIDIRINHSETSENRIQNNVIGLSPDGTRATGNHLGIDLQWSTWGNLVGGAGPNEHNVISGHQLWGNGISGGVDLSHRSTGNLVIGNYIGTTLDGRSATDETRNGSGFLIKDNPLDNYFSGNITASQHLGILNKQNYTGRNTWVENQWGVGVDGSDIGGSERAMEVRGHDDVYDGNIFANSTSTETIVISNTSDRSAAFEPDEWTERNTIRRSTFYRNGASDPIDWDNSNGLPHPNHDTPAITGVGPGQINGDSTCAGCLVEVYVSGSVSADGSLDPGTGTTGLTAIGIVTADDTGQWSLASSILTSGLHARAVSTTPSGETSDFTPQITIPTVGFGLVANPSQPITVPVPEAPPEPPIYQPVTFDCAFSDGTLSWDDADAPDYYVFARDAEGVETYLGGHQALQLAVPDADSYRVEHWVRGIATNATCAGPGIPQSACTYSDGLLTWTDAGADSYYVFATIGGVEQYLGGHQTLSLTVLAADSYRVEHWTTGQATNAWCDGPGVDTTPFTCSIADGLLTWDDVDAVAYYVFARDAADAETYLGGHPASGIEVPPADSYRVEHWLIGNATNAICSG